MVVEEEEEEEDEEEEGGGDQFPSSVLDSTVPWESHSRRTAYRS